MGIDDKEPLGPWKAGFCFDAAMGDMQNPLALQFYHPPASRSKARVHADNTPDPGLGNITLLRNLRGLQDYGKRSGRRRFLRAGQSFS